ncbi:unnamed protein product [Vicia faba]|uniref:BHLH domain-containing protein n=1 Tax=Vicia faba TaxID=3906 RepID=A0AAV0ZC24_VICFA|nr:unnamed protein product [Vicia faba]
MGVMYEEIRRNQEIDSKQHYHQQNNSLFTNLIDNNNNHHSYINNEECFATENYHPSTSSEMDTMLSKLISSNNGWSNCEEQLQEFDVKPVKKEIGESVGEHGDYSYGGSELTYQGFSSGSGNGFYGSFGGGNIIRDSENCAISKMGVRNCNNLVRQKSSPAGFFDSENGLTSLREDSNGQETIHGTLNFSSMPSTCLKRLPQIDENGIQIIEANGDSKSHHMPSFTNEFWDNSSFNAEKTETEDEIMFSTSTGLESHEEKFLQIQDSVPCKIRAKRGFATHPRSIAERVRRTRISDRIKKLQGLFPKSDKQTSTADMLDLAVEYIKDLQEQVQLLTDCKEKCKCTSHEKQHSRNCS